MARKEKINIDAAISSTVSRMVKPCGGVLTVQELEDLFLVELGNSTVLFSRNRAHLHVAIEIKTRSLQLESASKLEKIVFSRPMCELIQAYSDMLTETLFAQNVCTASFTSQSEAERLVGTDVDLKTYALMVLFLSVTSTRQLCDQASI